MNVLSMKVICSLEPIFIAVRNVQKSSVFALF